MSLGDVHYIGPALDQPDLDRLKLVMRIAALLPANHHEALLILEMVQDQITEFYGSGGAALLTF